MPSRRRYLATLGTVAASAAVAGCSAGGLIDTGQPPAGSLRLSNDDDVPHTLGVAVTDVGTDESGRANVTGNPTVFPPPRRISARNALEPGESKTYRSIFTAAVYYRVEFTMDGTAPESDAASAVAFKPDTTAGGGGQYLGAKVSKSGKFAWVLAGTDNDGQFS